MVNEFPGIASLPPRKVHVADGRSRSLDRWKTPVRARDCGNGLRRSRTDATLSAFPADALADVTVAGSAHERSAPAGPLPILLFFRSFVSPGKKCLDNDCLSNYIHCHGATKCLFLETHP